MKILAITDMDSTVSGYRTICVPLFTGLANLGHEIRVAGLMYQGQEHNHPFSIVPAQTFEDAYGIANNLVFMWNPDILLVALDIPLQGQIFQKIAPLLARTPEEVQKGLTIPRKYIAITPLENGPLTFSWAAKLMGMDSVFFISELGKQEALKAGVTRAEHLMIGVDTASWHPPTSEERETLRTNLGISPETFVILTVADNQERKNLWAGMKAVSLLKKETERPIKYIMVTREHSPFGWNLRDLAVSLDINQELVIYERGMPQRDLWGLYATADVYLQPSKAEGLGLPVLDAMACKVPVFATCTGAMIELLNNKENPEHYRGISIFPSYSFTDVWGNSNRDMISVDMLKNMLARFIVEKKLSDGQVYNWSMTDEAYSYVKGRTWDIPVQQVDQKIRELLNEQTIPSET